MLGGSNRPRNLNATSLLFRVKEVGRSLKPSARQAYLQPAGYLAYIGFSDIRSEGDTHSLGSGIKWVTAAIKEKS